jgi:hypothetical protein
VRAYAKSVEAGPGDMPEHEAVAELPTRGGHSEPI